MWWKAGRAIDYTLPTPPTFPYSPLRKPFPNPLRAR